MPRNPHSDEFELATRDLVKGRKRQNDVILWENRIQLSEQMYEDFNNEVQRNVDFYRGHQLGSGNDTSDAAFSNLAAYARSGRVLVVNKILASLAAQNSAIMWRRPWHYLRARRVTGLSDEEARWTAEHALNSVLGDPRNNWLQKARLMLLMAEMGIGVLKATYTLHTGKDPDKDRPERTGRIVNFEDPETGQTVSHFQGGIPRLDKKGQPISRGQGKFLIDQRELSDYYRSDFVHCFNMRFDPEGSNDTQDHLWIAEAVSWTHNEFMDIPFFDYKEQVVRVARTLDRKSLSNKAKRFYKSGGHDPSFEPTKSDKDLLRYYGFVCWDMRKREVTYIVSGFNKAVAKMKFPPYIDTHPYSIAKLHEDPGEFIPITEVAQARPMARAYNEMHSMLLTHAGRFTRRYVAKEGMFKDIEMEKMKSNDDGNIVQYGKMFSKADFDAVKDAALDPAIYRMMAMYERDMNQITGSSGNSQSTGEASETATESAIVENRTSNRDTDKRALVAASLQDHANKVLKMMQYTFPEDMLVNAVGPDAVPFQKHVNRAQMSGDFEAWIELSELEPHDARSERADWNEIVQLFGLKIFLSPTLSKRFLESRRNFDPQSVKELQQIAQLALQMEMQAAQGAASGGPEQGTEGKPKRPGGAKPSQSGGKSFEGRSRGREQRQKGNGAAKGAS